MNPQTLYGIFSLVIALLSVDYFVKHPVDVEAVKRTLRRLRDTLAKELTLDRIAFTGSAVICGWIIGVCVVNWAGYWL